MARRLKSDCRAPNAAAPRPMGQRPSWDEYGDASRTMPHRARLGGYRLNFSSSPKATARAVLVSFSLSLEIANADPEENGTTHSPRNPTPSLGLLTHSATASSTITHLKGRMRGGGWRRKGTFTRFSNHHQESIRRQPRGGFGSYAPLANRVTNTALSPALLWWGLRQRGVDNSVLQAQLSFICIQPTNLEYLSTDCPSKQRWRVANKLANTDAATVSPER